MIRFPAALRRIWWGNVESFPAGVNIHERSQLQLLVIFSFAHHNALPGRTWSG